jgi:hypothetical protein
MAQGIQVNNSGETDIFYIERKKRELYQYRERHSNSDIKMVVSTVENKHLADKGIINRIKKIPVNGKGRNISNLGKLIFRMARKIIIALRIRF